MDLKVNFCATFTKWGNSVPEDDVQEWLDNDGANPGFRLLSNTEMAAANAAAEEEAHEDNDNDEVASQPLPSYKHIRMDGSSVYLSL